MAEGKESMLRRVRYLTETEAAEALNIKPATLQTWRCTRRVDGPPFFKFGGAVRYADDKLAAWAASRVVA